MIFHNYYQELEELDVGDVVDGDDEAADVREGDDYGTVVVDALDGALNACEASRDETDLTAFLTEEIGIGHEGTPVGGVVNLHSTHKIEHLTLGNGDDDRGLVGGTGLDSHILQGGTTTVEHLEFTDPGTVAMEEDEVVNGGLLALDNLLTDSHDNMFHGKEILDTSLVEGLLDIELTGVGNIHGIPGQRPGG